MNRIKLALADNYPLLREGIAHFLKEESDIEVIGKASTGEELRAFLSQGTVNLVILDVNMPGLDSMRELDQLVVDFPKVRVLLLSTTFSTKEIVHLIQRGSRGYISKTEGKNELLKAIRKVAGGQVYLSPTLEQSLLKESQPKALPVQNRGGCFSFSLTRREREVLELMPEGYNNHDIAALLRVSKRTVDTLRQKLLEKTQMKNTASLIRFALTKGLISL